MNIKSELILTWIEEQKESTSIGLSEYDAGHENARMELLNELEEFIKSFKNESSPFGNPNARFACEMYPPRIP